MARHHRLHSLTPGFTPGTSTKIGMVRSDDIIRESHGYGKILIDYPVKDFDHAMYADMKVKPDQTYYYKVCAIDKAGLKGAFSDEVPVNTKQAVAVLKY